MTHHVHQHIQRLRLVPLLVVALAVLLGACADEGAGSEAGADVQDIVQQEVGALEEDIGALENRVAALEGAVPRDEDQPVVDDADADTAGVTDDTEEFIEDPESFVGQQVVVSGDISRVPDDIPDSFVLGGADFGGEGLLVLEATDAPIDELENQETVVQVTGTVRMFDIADFEEEFGVDYDDAALSPFEGQHVIVADSVESLGEAEPVKEEATE